MSACAWVTLATNDSYSLGALVLAHSLRKVGTVHQLAVMVTPGVTANMREQLRSVFDLVHDVNVLDSHDASNLALLARPELGITFTKLHCWSLTQYTKCVFMDADTLVLQACDELFDREELSAAPDVGWPDCFNSGVFVFQPSLDTFNKLIEFALTQGSFDGGDQGLLNLFFSNWATQDASRRLPFIYNMCSTAVYSYLPAFKQFGNDAKIVHFIGQMKPWLLELDTQSGLVTPSPGYEHLRPILQQWWSLFLGDVLPKLQPDMGGMAGALAQLSIGSPRSEQQVALEQHWRRQAWEHGNADYLGKDAFDKIWQKIQDTLQGVQPPASGDTPPAPAPPSPVEASPPPVQAPPPAQASPPAPVEAPAQPSEVTPREEVATPVSVAPKTPPPGDKKTPVQTPPSASASKSEPLAAPPSGAESAPIPPKRRGGPNKGGKSGQKGKK